MSKTAGLRIKKSTIPQAGRGLFSTRPFEKDETVAHYTGDIAVGRRVMKGNFGGSDYLFAVNDSVGIDAARTNTAPGRMINASDKPGNRIPPNVRWVADQRNRRVRLVATKRIPAGTEIFVPYGSGYWKKQEDLESEREKRAKARVQDAADRAAGKAPARVPVGRKGRQSVAIQPDEEDFEERKSVEPEDDLDVEEDQGWRPEDFISPPQSYATSVLSNDPRNHAEAMASPDAASWRAAEAEEEKSLMDHGVFERVDRLPPGKRLLRMRWVYRAKLDQRNQPIRFKGRLVVQGFAQREGIDFGETSAPTVLPKSLKTFFAVSAALGHKVRALDVKTAYLHADVKEELYVECPEGFKSFPAGSILRLRKSLYGLRQAGFNFNELATRILVNVLGFTQLEYADVCVFVKVSRTGNEIRAVLYVDDIDIGHDDIDLKEVEELIALLSKHLDIKDLGDCTSMIGYRVTRTPHSDGTVSIALDLTAMIDRVCAEFGFANECKNERIPMRAGTKPIALKSISEETRSEIRARQLDPNAPDRGVLNEKNYACFVGAVNFIATVRPDIAFAINWLARFISCPIQEAIAAGKQLLKYLKSTRDLKHTFRGSRFALLLKALSDSDWANDEEDAVSVTGSLVMLAGAAVDWRSQKQKGVANSSSEAEYIAASETSRDVVWFRELLKGMGLEQTVATPLLMDNQTSIRFVEESTVTPRRKHINVRYHYVRELFRKGIVKPEWVSTQDNPADLFTKALPADSFTRFRNVIMGIRD